jgi:hypothetical protein
VETPRTDAPALRRVIRLHHATAMVVGTIIGASIFVQPSEITGRVPSCLGRKFGSPPASVAGRADGGTTSAADGTFVIKGLPDGRYRLKADKTGFAPTELDREVELAGGPVFDVEIRLSAGGVVAWYFNYDDPDTGGVAMTIVIDAHTGVVVFTDP